MKKRLFVRDAVVMLRPRDWSKNVFVFAIPFLLAIPVSGSLLAGLAGGFLLFCIASSSVYVFNDLLDADRDRLDPAKRRSPVTSGAVPRPAGFIVSVLLALLCLLVAARLRPGLVPFLASYLVLNAFYSVLGRDIAVVDALCVIAGFLIRAVAGAVAAVIAVSPVLLLTVFLLVAGLVLLKRICEISFFGANVRRFRSWLSVKLRIPLLILAFAAFLLAAGVHLCWLLTATGFVAGFWRFIPFLPAGLALWRTFEAVRKNRKSPSLWTVLFSDRSVAVFSGLWIVSFVLVAYLVPALRS